MEQSGGWGSVADLFCICLDLPKRRSVDVEGVGRGVGR